MNSEYFNDYLKELAQRGLATREIHAKEMNAATTGHFVGAEIMLHYLAEEPEEIEKFLEIIRECPK